MSANINTYVGRQSAWHNLGTVTGSYLTWGELLAHGGLNFQVEKQPLFDQFGNKLDTYGVFRYDLGMTKAGTFLGPVGEGYQTIDHSKGFELVDTLMATADGAHYETAGVLGKGEVVWGLADLGLVARVGDDVQKGYLLFATGHTGNMTYQFRICMERVVCQNTLNIALSQGTKNVFRVKHTKNSGIKMTDAHAALVGLSIDVATMEKKLQFLVTRKVTRESYVAVMDRIFPAKKDADGEESSSTRRKNILTDILQTYDFNDGNAFPEQRGSAYNLLNAITNYTDHQRSSKGDMRSESALFGSGDKLKGIALETLLEVSKDMPTLTWNDVDSNKQAGVMELERMMGL